jgi:transcriptional regulator with XRE-family HTH domain
MSHKLTDYEAFETSSVSNRRLLRQEELILEVTEALSAALEKEGITKKDLAERLGKTKGFVSQVLAGGRNLTLRTIADVADALECRIRIHCEKPRQMVKEVMVLFNDYGRTVVPWRLPDQPVILKTVSREKAELSEETLVSLFGRAA